MPADPIATVHVTPDAQPETLAALAEMVRLAVQLHETLGHAASITPAAYRTLPVPPYAPPHEPAMAPILPEAPDA